VYIKSQVHWIYPLTIMKICFWHWSRLQCCLVGEIIWPFWLAFVPLYMSLDR
jgi:hypothetical protein